MLAMSTVLRREAPFKAIFGYALVFAEDGRQMHKSWGNAIEFDEAAERMGVDVMRWMFAKARPEDNILFGWHAADEARRELLVLWNVYSFFVTYARLAGWRPTDPAPPVGERPTLDRWILSRLAGLAARVEDRLGDYDPELRPPLPSRASSTSSPPGTCAGPAAASRGRLMARTARPRSRRSTRPLPALPGCRPRCCPFLSEAIHQNLVVAGTRWPRRTAST